MLVLISEPSFNHCTSTAISTVHFIVTGDPTSSLYNMSSTFTVGLLAVEDTKNICNYN